MSKRSRPGRSAVLVVCTALVALLALVSAFLLTRNTAPNYSSDVRWLYRAISENYPFFGVHQRQDAIDWRARAGRIIETTDLDSLDASSFKPFLHRLLEGLNGHAGILDRRQYGYYLNIYSGILPSHPEYKPWVDALERKRTLDAYGAVSGKRPDFQPDKPEALPIFGRAQSSLRLELRSGSIVIVVPTYDALYSELDRKAIADYLRQHASPATPIVIDQRGNGGGSSLYWMEGIVAPLLAKGESLECRSLVLLRGGAASMRFARAIHPDIRSISTFDAVVSPASERADFRSWFSDTTTAKAAPETFPHGPIFLLTNGRNFSASEGFALFCKVTGFARLVGARTGGDGIGFDPILLSLPSSGLIVTLPVTLGLNPDGGINYEMGTVPDIEVPPEDDALSVALSLARP